MQQSDPPWNVSLPGVDGQEINFRDHALRVWKRAKAEVKSASMISFVGLSMHDYLADGLKGLFEEVSQDAVFLSASTDNLHKKHHQKWSRTPAGRLSNWLKPTLKRDVDVYPL